MSRYKIHIDPQPPTSEEMAQHKNFDRVLRLYERRRKKRRPLHTIFQRFNKWAPILLLIILMLVLIVFFF